MPPLDEDTTRRLRSLRSEAPITPYEKLVMSFSASAPLFAIDAQEALAKGDFAKVADHLHRLKGMSGMIGAIRVYQIAREMEHRAETGQAIQKRDLARIERECELFLFQATILLQRDFLVQRYG